MTKPAEGVREGVRESVREGASEGQGGPSVRGEGTWVTAVGQVLGNFVVSLVVGDALQSTLDGARSWRVWNWPPFFVVLGLGGAALLRTPEGPGDQVLWSYLMIGSAVLIALVRVVGIRGRAGAQALASALSVALAVGGTVWVEQVRGHGEADVAGLTTVTPSRPLRDGETLVVGVDGGPVRTHLRLVLRVEDADPDMQSCTPETRLALRLGGGPSTVDDARSGRPVDIRLGGVRDGIRVTVTVRTDAGCRMNVFVDDAVLHG
ncbi:hypothetical protein ACH4Y0_40770 [Streptomyces sp. NPDC020707]|uniref:hypothetical protein n=1 Tax=Streptomyces sp. NPDC020707 TaxID=3365084 RepID=UPI0037949B16